MELGEAHFWPHARAAGDLSSPDAVKIVTRGDGVWVYDQAGSRLFDTLSGMWLSNIGHGRREVADAVHAQICELGYAPDGSVHPTTLRLGRPGRRAGARSGLAGVLHQRRFRGGRDRDEDGEEVPSQPR